MTRYAMLGLLTVGLLGDLAGCCCLAPKEPFVEPPAPVVQAPPAMPAYVEPPPAPQPPPPPPVVAAPPPARLLRRWCRRLPPRRSRSSVTSIPACSSSTKNKGMLYFNSDVTFDSGSAVVKADARAALDNSPRSSTTTRPRTAS